ncbi:MAG: hypothetical protein K9N62_13085 [Verrucomicrobia bacterium]|nr:hypothetical protein [Verrucomicrobiota bacterium]
MKTKFGTLMRTGALASALAFGGSGHAAAASGGDNVGSPALPLSEVVLYSSGVGYFQRAGQVSGNAVVDLKFKADDINDLLKSMVVQDFGGGRVASVSYGSSDPLSKSLRSFAIDLTENPGMGVLLNQVRGEPIEVQRPGPVQGILLGVESRQVSGQDGKPVEREFVNLLTEAGLQSIELAQITGIRLQNERVDKELRSALAMLAAGHDTQKKSVSLRFEGEGRREVGVSYVIQTPVWKTSYRLVLEDGEAPFLQGWAIVENTSDEDWSDVRLSLVSGRPISFSMNLYEPLYSERPVVEPELYSSLRPQIYGEAMEFKGMASAASAPGPMMADSMALGGMAGGRGVLARSSTLRKAGLESVNGVARGGGLGGGGSLDLQTGVSSSASGSETGELFAYAIQSPVTLARQQSALLPIVNEGVKGQKVSIYNESVHNKRPLNGFRLKNSSALHLMQGPITVFDGSAYAGDARIDDLAPGEERLISYAVDLGIEVEPRVGAGKQELQTAMISRGVMTIVRKAIERKSYLVRNRDSEKRTLLVEHPVRDGWELVSKPAPEERTREVYRFLVTLAPDQSEKLEVIEERKVYERVGLLALNSDAIGVYLSAREFDGRIRSVLERLMKMRNALGELSVERTRREQRVSEITQEHARIRENMARLDTGSELYVRYVKKLDEQETELEGLRREIKTLSDQEASKQREMNDYLMSLEIE